MGLAQLLMAVFGQALIATTPQFLATTEAAPTPHNNASQLLFLLPFQLQLLLFQFQLQLQLAPTPTVRLTTARTVLPRTIASGLVNSAISLSFLALLPDVPTRLLNVEVAQLMCNVVLVDDAAKEHA